MKSLEKIRQARKCICNTKKQTSKQKTQRQTKQCGCAHTIQNAKSKQAKNLIHLFPHNTIKKSQEQSTRKAQNKISMHSKICSKKSAVSICTKAHN